MAILSRLPVPAAALALLLLGAAPPTFSGLQQKEPELPEYVLKAGFLFNFAKYVEWPAEAFDGPAAPIRIGIVGKDPFGEILNKTLKDKVVNGRPFLIERAGEPSDLKRCHILFVSRAEKGRIAAILDQVRAWGVLTVGEDAGFAQAGGSITILIEGDAPKLEINPEAALAHNVKIHSKLLKVATIVRTEK
jgi:hypothetical protein